MDADLRKKLKDLQKEIEYRAKYLQDSTYHPYDTILISIPLLLHHHLK